MSCAYRSVWIKKGDSYLQSHLPDLSKAGVETPKQECFDFRQKGSAGTFSAFAVNWNPGLELQAFELVTQHQTSQDTTLPWLSCRQSFRGAVAKRKLLWLEKCFTTTPVKKQWVFVLFFGNHWLSVDVSNLVVEFTALDQTIIKISTWTVFLNYSQKHKIRSEYFTWLTVILTSWIFKRKISHSMD